MGGYDRGKNQTPPIIGARRVSLGKGMSGKIKTKRGGLKI